MKILPWEPDNDVFGEAAAISAGERFLDLVITPTASGVVWDVVDGSEIVATGYAEDMTAAKRAAEVAGCRALIRIVIDNV
ncbi:hypothetical protein ABID16_003089 [Rhizobium aquaticum]|uniref:BON domain-containing protein n=1 Tax=Rhizobium aquaticum TaxID=1549636 RepID=A0ABV2J1W4_9HYPH